jgi:hypothetical protein
VTDALVLQSRLLELWIGVDVYFGGNSSLLFSGNQMLLAFQVMKHAFQRQISGFGDFASYLPERVCSHDLPFVLVEKEEMSPVLFTMIAGRGRDRQRNLHLAARELGNVKQLGLHNREVDVGGSLGS